MSEKMGMEGEVIDSIDIREACWSRGDNLCVKLASRNGVRTVNKYKRNLNQDFNCDDFIAPALERHEDVLIQHGAGGTQRKKKLAIKGVKTDINGAKLMCCLCIINLS